MKLIPERLLQISCPQWLDIFLISYEAEVGIILPELNTTNHISVPFHVADQKSNYNVIFGRDLLRELRISLYFQNTFVG